MAGVTVTPEQLAALRATLLNTSGSTPLHERFRALFMLKAVGGDEVIAIIAEGEFAVPFDFCPNSAQASRTTRPSSSTSSPTSSASSSRSPPSPSSRRC